MSLLQECDGKPFAQGNDTVTVELLARARAHCEQLESGKVLNFASSPVELSHDDRQFLLRQRQDGSRLHKNISYRPKTDALRGFAADNDEDAARLHAILRDYSQRVIRFLAGFLQPYADKWSLDFASFRPLEEQGRDLPLHKRNDLLHVDAFPTRPTHGGRILRYFTNVNPSRPRVWNSTSEPFAALAQRFAAEAGLKRFAARGRSRSRGVLRRIRGLKRAVGLPAPDHSPYDEFMLRFHDFLKENDDLQTRWPKVRIEFPPSSSWIVFTDGVPHAVLSGQYALEQTLIIPAAALLAPRHSPIRILEGLCGQSLLNRAA
jgi:3-deoxy-D-manno-oct-2-ulosonic acid (Kdo) hydroxylase